VTVTQFLCALYLPCGIVCRICIGEIHCFIILFTIFCWQCKLCKYADPNLRMYVCMYVIQSDGVMSFLCLFSWEKPYVCVTLLLVCNIFCIFLPTGKCQQRSWLIACLWWTSISYCNCVLLVSVWFTGNTLVLINVVAICRARLVPGWVTVLRWVKHLGAEPGTLVN